MQHYLLIKRDALSRSGLPLDAAQSALVLLNARIWPLWRGTPNRMRVAAGDEVAIYLAGANESRVIARAGVERIGSWTRELARAHYDHLLVLLRLHARAGVPAQDIARLLDDALQPS